MIFASPFVDCFSNPEAPILTILRKLIANDYAPVLVKPGTKIPMCPLTSKAKQEADLQAKQKAKDEGNPRWDKVSHDCGFSHILTKDDVSKLPTLLKRVEKRYNGRPNIALNIGKSRFLVVDVDTPEQREAFFREWTEAEGVYAEDKSLTVSSPGVIDDNGVERHKDGGHIYFHIPDQTQLPTNIQSYEAPSGWVAKWGNSIVLTPGSVRKEGPYKLVSRPELEIPSWLSSRLHNEASARAEEHRQRTEQWESRDLSEMDEAIVDWNSTMDWNEILLEEDGWSLSGEDSCGCPVYGLEGRASSKTATAHDNDCFGKGLPIPGLMHLWTDTPPDYLPDGTKNITKFKYVSFRHFNGRKDYALSQLGITIVQEENKEVEEDEVDSDEMINSNDKPDINAILKNSGPVLAWGSEIPIKKQTWLWHRRIPMETFTLVTGDGGVGKTTFIAWVDAMVTTGGNASGAFKGDLNGIPSRVLYISHEDVPGTSIIPRHRAAGADLDKFMTVTANAEQFALPQGARKLKDVIVKYDIKLVIIDPILSFMNIQSENSKLEVRSALNPLNAILQETGAAGIGIHHPNKATSMSLTHRAAGSGAFNELARSSLFVLLDKNTGLRYVGVYKTNLGADTDSSPRFKLNIEEITYQVEDKNGNPDGYETTTASSFEYYDTSYNDINKVYHVLQKAEADQRAEDKDLSILDRSVEDAVAEACKTEIMLSGDLRLGHSTPGRVTIEKLISVVQQKFQVDDKLITNVLNDDMFVKEQDYDSYNDTVTTYYTLKQENEDSS